MLQPPSTSSTRCTDASFTATCGFPASRSGTHVDDVAHPPTPTTHATQATTLVMANVPRRVITSHAERFAARAGLHFVRVLQHEARLHQRLLPLEHGATEIDHRLRVDDDLGAVRLEHFVARLGR